MQGRQGKKARLLTSRWEERGSSHGRDDCLWKKPPPDPREEECRHFCRAVFLQPAGPEWTPSEISLCDSSFTRIKSHTHNNKGTLAILTSPLRVGPGNRQAWEGAGSARR